MTSLNNAVVLVTGANRGIGEHFVEEALARGAAKVYATARNPRAWDDDRVVPLTLDVTDPDSVKAAAETAPDVTVVVNNAGVAPTTGSLLAVGDDELRSVMETNFFGPLNITRAFAPALTAADSAALIDLHSVLAWYPVAGVYSVSKAALASATNALRLELAPAGVQVVGVYMAYVDTAMAAADAPSKIAPADLVRAVFDTTEAGGHEVLADEQTVQVRSVLNQPVDVLLPQLAGEAQS
jgi:NAD(P)-dependent dehydrogenase (short-subunit alcohol dehydrogenase family)